MGQGGVRRGKEGEGREKWGIGGGVGTGKRGKDK